MDKGEGLKGTGEMGGWMEKGQGRWLKGEG